MPTQQPGPTSSRKFRAPVPPRSQDANNVSPKNGVPPNQVFSPGTDQFENPGDEASFTSGNNDHSPMGTKVKTSTKQPAPAGTRPMNVKGGGRVPKAPGLVRNGSLRAAPPKAPGLAPTLSKVANAKPKAKGLNQTVTPARGTPRAAGIAPTISMQKTRNMRSGSANSAFYGDFQAVNGKLSHSAVGFEHPAKGPDHCSRCVHFRKDGCAIVRDPVTAGDWCERFKEKRVVKDSSRNKAFYGETQMPSVSQAQQGFMGAELRRKREGLPTKTNMREEQLKEFAATPRKKLPKRAPKRKSNPAFYGE